MKVIVRAQLVTDWGEIREVTVAEIERPAAAFDGSSLGLSLSDGKQVMHALQQEVASAQANEICGLCRVCQRCSRWNPVKDCRQRKVDSAPRANRSGIASDVGNRTNDEKGVAGRSQQAALVLVASRSLMRSRSTSGTPIHVAYGSRPRQRGQSVAKQMNRASFQGPTPCRQDKPLPHVG